MDARNAHDGDEARDLVSCLATSSVGKACALRKFVAAALPLAAIASESFVALLCAVMAYGSFLVSHATESIGHPIGPWTAANAFLNPWVVLGLCTTSWILRPLLGLISDTWDPQDAAFNFLSLGLSSHARGKLRRPRRTSQSAWLTLGAAVSCVAFGGLAHVLNSRFAADGAVTSAESASHLFRNSLWGWVAAALAAVGIVGMCLICTVSEGMVVKRLREEHPEHVVLNIAVATLVRLLSMTTANLIFYFVAGNALAAFGAPELAVALNGGVPTPQLTREQELKETSVAMWALLDAIKWSACLASLFGAFFIAGLSFISPDFPLWVSKRRLAGWRGASVTPNVPLPELQFSENRTAEFSSSFSTSVSKLRWCFRWESLMTFVGATRSAKAVAPTPAVANLSIPTRLGLWARRFLKMSRKARETGGLLSQPSDKNSEKAFLRNGIHQHFSQPDRGFGGNNSDIESSPETEMMVAGVHRSKDATAPEATRLFEPEDSGHNFKSRGFRKQSISTTDTERQQRSDEGGSFSEVELPPVTSSAACTSEEVSSRAAYDFSGIVPLSLCVLLNIMVVDPDIFLRPLTDFGVEVSGWNTQIPMSLPIAVGVGQLLGIAGCLVAAANWSCGIITLRRCILVPFILSCILCGLQSVAQFHKYSSLSAPSVLKVLFAPLMPLVDLSWSPSTMLFRVLVMSALQAVTTLPVLVAACRLCPHGIEASLVATVRVVITASAVGASQVHIWLSETLLKRVDSLSHFFAFAPVPPRDIYQTRAGEAAASTWTLTGSLNPMPPSPLPHDMQVLGTPGFAAARSFSAQILSFAVLLLPVILTLWTRVEPKWKTMTALASVKTLVRACETSLEEVPGKPSSRRVSQVSAERKLDDVLLQDEVCLEHHGGELSGLLHRRVS